MIELLELPRERFSSYRDDLSRDYARDKVRAGAWSPEEAPRRAAADLDGLLANGPEAEGHDLYLLRDRSTVKEVGVVWLAVQDSGVGRSVWIYDIQIHGPLRRMGYGTQALQAVEEWAIELGAASVELNVFGHNPAARALYEKVGYETTSVVMAKRLAGEKT